MYHGIIADLEARQALIANAIAALRQLSTAESAAPIKLPTVEPQPAPVRPPKAARPVTACREAQPDKPAPLRDAIMKAFVRANGPLTSGEVFDSLRHAGVATTAGSVYQCLRGIASDRGWIELRLDEEGDCRNRWFLTDAGKQALA